MNEILRGMVYMLAATIFLALMNAIIKYVSNLGYPSMENIFFRAFFMMLSMLCVSFAAPFCNRVFKTQLKRPVFASKKPGGFRMIALRSFLGAVAMSMAYYNFATISLGIATAFLQSAPLFVVFFGLFTRNRPRGFVVFASVVGFAGVLCIANPDSGEITSLNAIAGIIGAVCSAFAFFTLNALKSYYSSGAIVLWYGTMMSILGGLGMLLPVPNMGGFVLPSLEILCLFVAAGIIGTIGQWFMTQSYLLAPAPIVSPIGYMRIVWGLFLGVWLGDVLPSATSSVGIALIILSGFLIALPSLWRLKMVRLWRLQIARRFHVKG